MTTLMLIANTRTRRGLRRLVVATFLLAGIANVPPAAAERSAQFLVTCVDSHRADVDPIVHEGDHTGKSHFHEFTGSTSTNADSTYNAMTRSGHTCDKQGDTAGYWTPVLYNPAGEVVRKRYSAAYYVSVLGDRRDVKPFPAGMKMIADFSNPAAFRHGSGWHCGYAIRDPERTTTKIPDCEKYNGRNDDVYGPVTLLQARIAFPDCWDGVRTDSADHREHVAYSGVKELCPSSHPVRIPRLRLQNVYDTFGGPDFKLSSGPGSSMHVDFWNTWDQKILEDLVEFCLNGSAPDPDRKCAEGERRYENPTFPHANTLDPFKWPPPSNEGKARISVLGVDGKDELSGMVKIQAKPDPRDNIAISRVEFVIDGKAQAVANSSTPINNTPPYVVHAPYELMLDTSCLPNGSHTLDTEAVGITGRRGHPVPRISFRTKNAPRSEPCPDPAGHEMPGGGGGMPRDMTPPEPPSKLAATPAGASPNAVNLTWDASSTPDDVARYEIVRNDAVLESTTTETAYVDTGLVLDRTYTYAVRAVDAAGNRSANSNSVSFRPSGSDTSAPYVELTGLGDDQQIATGDVTFSAEAYDQPGPPIDGTNINRVEFRVNNDLKRTDKTAPYTYEVDTRTMKNGNFPVSATAFDTVKPVPNMGKAVINVTFRNDDTTRPSTPKNLKVTDVTPTSVSLTWDPSTDPGVNPSGIKYYDVLRNGVSIQRDECTRNPSDENECTLTHFTDLRASANTKYKYGVRAVDKFSNQSSISSRSVTTPRAARASRSGSAR